MGDLEAQSTKTQAAQPWSYQLFTMLLLMLFAMSVLTVYVAIKSSQNAQKIDDLQNIYVDDRFKVEQVLSIFHVCILQAWLVCFQ